MIFNNNKDTSLAEATDIKQVKELISNDIQIPEQGNKIPNDFEKTSGVLIPSTNAIFRHKIVSK